MWVQAEDAEGGPHGAVSINPGGLVLETVHVEPVERGASSVTSLLPRASLRSTSLDPAGLCLPTSLTFCLQSIVQAHEAWCPELSLGGLPWAIHVCICWPLQLYGYNSSSFRPIKLAQSPQSPQGAMTAGVKLNNVHFEECARERAKPVHDRLMSAKDRLQQALYPSSDHKAVTCRWIVFNGCALQPDCTCFRRTFFG